MLFQHGNIIHSHAVLDRDLVTRFFKDFKKKDFDKVHIEYQTAQETVYETDHSPNDNWVDDFLRIQWDIIRVISMDFSTTPMLTLQIHNDECGKMVVWSSRNDRLMPGETTPLTELPHTVKGILSKCWCN